MGLSENVLESFSHDGGIGVYSNAVGPVAGNMFVANVAEDNRGNAITTGGVGHVPSKTSLGNIFASNIARNNAGHNGGQCALPTSTPAQRSNPAPPSGRPSS